MVVIMVQVRMSWEQNHDISMVSQKLHRITNGATASEALNLFSRKFKWVLAVRHYIGIVNTLGG